MSIDGSGIFLSSARWAMLVDLELLGRLIRQEREHRQLSQEGLAALSGLSRTYLGEIERGAVGLSFASLVAIADGFKMQPSELVLKYEEDLAKGS